MERDEETVRKLLGHLDFEEIEGIETNVLRDCLGRRAQEGGGGTDGGASSTAPAAGAANNVTSKSGTGGQSQGKGGGDKGTEEGPEQGAGVDGFKSYAEMLKQRIEQRIAEETLQKAKTCETLNTALKDQQKAREQISVMVALIDYLQELKTNLDTRPEEFYCSLDLPGSSSSSRRKERTEGSEDEANLMTE